MSVAIQTPPFPGRVPRQRQRWATRWPARAALLGLALLALAGCETLFPESATPPEGVAAVVQMTNLLDFNPREVVIQVGETVEWQNASLFTHTVTADATLARDPTNVELPPGAQPFHSGDIRQDGTFRFTFSVPGTYRYVCLPHERLGMVGVVIVEPRG